MRRSRQTSLRRPIHVLVVDDSAIVRQVATAILGEQRDITTSMAADPIVARHCIEIRRPDVIVLDLEMPRMDGLTFLRELMNRDPIPVVICSALSRRGSETALRALEAGALDVITKPSMGVREFLEDSAIILIDAVRAASRAHVGRRRMVSRANVEAGPSLTVTTDKVIAIGASTGGTRAIQTILEAMPAGCPGIAIVQHMPEVFTAAFARRLNETCRIEVKEAAQGDRLFPGRALIAPGNQHLQVRRSGAYYTASLTSGPLVSRHRPSVDVLFRSVGKAAGANAVGVILTGMGDDGVEGLMAMKMSGAATIAQDEESSVVFGMPKEAIVRGAAEKVVPLHLIPAVALRLSASRRHARSRDRARSVG